MRVRPIHANIHPGCLFTLGDFPQPYLAVDVEILNPGSTLGPTHRIIAAECGNNGKPRQVTLYYSDQVEVIGEGG